jgi:hypothetical protein
MFGVPVRTKRSQIERQHSLFLPERIRTPVPVVPSVLLESRGTELCCCRGL